MTIVTVSKSDKELKEPVAINIAVETTDVKHNTMLKVEQLLRRISNKLNLCYLVHYK